MNKYLLSKLCNSVAGILNGDPNIEITGCAGIDSAVEGHITFAATDKNLAKLNQSKASAFVVPQGVTIDKPSIQVKNPRLAFAILLDLFTEPHSVPSGLAKTAVIAKNAVIGENTKVGDLAYIGENTIIGSNCVIYPTSYIGANVTIGNNTVIYPKAVVLDKVIIGNRCVLHAGAVLGADGFGYVFDAGKHHKVPQIGTVELGNDVEIGANATIDRATTGATRIDDGTKIDNHVQVAHNVQVGKHCIIVALTGIGGSTTLEDYVVLGGQVGLKDHITIGTGAKVGSQAGVWSNTPAGVTYWGTPAMPQRENLELLSYTKKLPGLFKRIKELEEKIKQLENND